MNVKNWSEPCQIDSLKEAAFSINEDSIAKQIADECRGEIVVKNATFKDYIRQ